MNNAANKTSLGALRSHLFDVIERLKTTSDPEASEKDLISVDAANTIAKISTCIVNSAKVESDVLKTIAFAQNPTMVQSFMNQSSGLLLENGSSEQPKP